jgi:hypothetical protein
MARVLVTRCRSLVALAAAALAAAACARGTSASADAPPSAPDGVLRLDEAWTPALAARLTKQAEALPRGTMQFPPPPDAERDRAIRASFGERCRLERTCGPIWGIDCEAAVDGPYFYVRPRVDRLERITTCGGACMGGRCTNCPPRNEGWTCATY